jgi:mono/diheme cytochrome c family protein/glucose/arabinose dehydrogenase/lysophospholipase L1-like esterase
MKIKNFKIVAIFLAMVATVVFLSTTAFSPIFAKKLAISKDTRISLIGSNLGSRMLNYGHFDTEFHLRFPQSQVTIRNMCDGGDTPGFRPHAGRNSPWAFMGAEKFQTALAKDSHSEGFYESPDEWLTRLETDIVIAFFGFSESFDGAAGVKRYKDELEAFIKHTMNQKYNGATPPQLALVSPTAFQNLSAKYDVPNGINENINIALYAKAMEEVAKKFNVLYLDAFTPSKKWYESGEELTIDGMQLNDAGYKKFAQLLVEGLFDSAPVKNESKREALLKAVLDKDWYWHNDYKIPNGVHVFGQRYKPFGPDNYPAEITKTRQMTANRDTQIWAIANGFNYDLALADSKTISLPPVETNYTMADKVRYLYGEEALKTFKVADGFKIDLFASEKEFPDLANPVQISFDNKGRLWVAVMPMYPHHRIGDGKPSDKIIILEDTNSDGKADKQTTFADDLHLPIGFELTPEGVYVSQSTNLKLYKDTNGDDKADKSEIVLSGFDDHDTHHAISAFTTDEAGGILMGEGIFLHTNVETPYGTVRATHAGVMRYDPMKKKLERMAQLPITNPWGIGYDDWGQSFILSTSNPDVHWLAPGTNKSFYGLASPVAKPLIEESQRVRPTSGLEFVSSRHFPDNMQGAMMYHNTIGFLGTKVHKVLDDGTGFKTQYMMDLVKSSDPNFRPVDLEFAPDGSLYLADWHNVLIGHMQHNARDPLRDHVHGRIYRITYPSRPLLTPANVSGASIEALLENLKQPEYRTRFRSRRELRGRNANEVLAKLDTWVNNLSTSDKQYEHNLLEALWVTWGLNKINQNLLSKALNAKDEKVRSAAVTVLRYNTDKIKNHAELFRKAAADKSGRVRLMVLAASTWLKKADEMSIRAIVEKNPVDEWIKPHLDFIKNPKETVMESNIKKKLTKGETMMAKGKEIYSKEGYCVTCHQPNGNGLDASGFPPLVQSGWVTGNKERLIKVVLHGLMGPIEVNNKKYPGDVPMTPYGGMLTDEEISAVLNYIRNSWGNTTEEPITMEDVKAVREQTKKQKGFYTAAELLKLHPDK